MQQLTLPSNPIILYTYEGNNKCPLNNNIPFFLENVKECRWNSDDGCGKYLMLYTFRDGVSKTIDIHVAFGIRVHDFENQFPHWPYSRKNNDSKINEVLKRMDAIEAQNTILITHLEAICTTLGARAMDADPIDFNLNVTNKN
jgi:hypothetical protein